MLEAVEGEVADQEDEDGRQRCSPHRQQIHRRRCLIGSTFPHSTVRYPSTIEAIGFTHRITRAGLKPTPKSVACVPNCFEGIKNGRQEKPGHQPHIQDHRDITIKNMHRAQKKSDP
jgi:hypothetical protein